VVVKVGIPYGPSTLLSGFTISYLNSYLVAPVIIPHVKLTASPTRGETIELVMFIHTGAIAVDVHVVKISVIVKIEPPSGLTKKLSVSLSPPAHWAMPMYGFFRPTHLK
jgi:putative flippase GtrA